METEFVVALVVSLAVLVYLVAAMVMPEGF